MKLDEGILEGHFPTRFADILLTSELCIGSLSGGFAAEHGILGFPYLAVETSPHVREHAFARVILRQVYPLGGIHGQVKKFFSRRQAVCDPVLNHLVSTDPQLCIEQRVFKRVGA